MGQKANPNGFRLGIIKDWQSKWYSDDKFAEFLYEDEIIRKYIRKRLERGGVAKVQIERTSRKVTVTIFTSRPGIVIGKKGEEVEKLKLELQHLTGKEVHINVKEVKKPEIDAVLVADNVASQLTGRVSYKRAAKKAISTAMRMGAEGIKIIISGRLNGAEIARVETFKEGRIPLHTIRADIDYALAEANTTYGIIGVKVWICKGEIVKEENLLEKEEVK